MPSERARPRAQTVAALRGLSVTKHTRASKTASARMFHLGGSPPPVCPSLHHPWSPPSRSFSCAPRARPPPPIGQSVDWMGTMGGAGALSPTAREGSCLSCRDSAPITDSVVTPDQWPRSPLKALKKGVPAPRGGLGSSASRCCSFVRVLLITPPGCAHRQQETHGGLSRCCAQGKLKLWCRHA